MENDKTQPKVGVVPPSDPGCHTMADPVQARFGLDTAVLQKLYNYFAQHQNKQSQALLLLKIDPLLILLPMPVCS